MLADGTYATQSAVAAEPAVSAAEVVPPLRKLRRGRRVPRHRRRDRVRKLALRMMGEQGPQAPAAKRMQVRALKRSAASRSSSVPPVARASSALARTPARAVRGDTADPNDGELLMPVFVGACREASRYLAQAKPADGADAGDDEKKGAVRARPADLISWRQLRRGGASERRLYEGATSRATGGRGRGLRRAALARAQLSGFADPVYAEACVGCTTTTSCSRSS